MKYLSGILTQIQIFAEFFFDILNERDEPIVFVFEALKAMIRLREYASLVNNEKIKTYIDFETYKHLKETESYEDSLCKMVRSNKVVQKPAVKLVSPGLQELITRQAENLRKPAIKKPREEKRGFVQSVLKMI